MLLWHAAKIVTWDQAHGVKYAVLSPPGVDEGLCLARLSEAFDLLHTAVPYRVNRMRSDLRGILCAPTGDKATIGAFAPALGLALIDPSYCARDDVTPEDIAATIIHEATHARIHALGIGHKHELLGRIETICQRAEKDFARKRGMLNESL